MKIVFRIFQKGRSVPDVAAISYCSLSLTLSDSSGVEDCVGLYRWIVRPDQ